MPHVCCNASVRALLLEELGLPHIVGMTSCWINVGSMPRLSVFCICYSRTVLFFTAKTISTITHACVISTRHIFTPHSKTGSIGIILHDPIIRFIFPFPEELDHEVMTCMDGRYSISRACFHRSLWPPASAVVPAK